MREVITEFHSGDLTLEGVLYMPEEGGPRPAVIVCHPHPLYGGSMDNNVVNCLCSALNAGSLISFKFNFRGIGRSQGDFGDGAGEQEDVSSAISFITTLSEVDPERVGLIGYSAGAAFALPVGCEDPRIKALGATSPPLAMFDFEFLTSCAKPKILISGSRDDFTPAGHFVEFCQNLPNPIEYDLIEGADHFWWGYEPEMARKTAAFFAKTLNH
jgi:alpha/beta superfamily hydrolase